MRFSQVVKFFRQLPRYILEIFLGVLLAFTSLWVLPALAEATVVIPRESSVAAISASSFVTAAVKRVGPAVVRIDTEKTITRPVDPIFEDPFFRRFFGDSFSEQSPTEQLRGLGSGFIIDETGLILTNAHVVDQADKVTVRLKDGRTFEGKVKGIDEVTDLAVVKINAGNHLPIAPLGDSDLLQVGDWAIAVGNPLGFDNTVTLGIISTLKRSSVQVGISDKRLEFIQTDAAINPGNSGGPLVNAAGEVIGINTAIRADAMGIGFAIPIDKAKAIAAQLQRDGKVAHPYLGVQMITLTPTLAKKNNSDPNSTFIIPEVSGVLVMRVIPNSPAARGGIRRGDVILQIDHHPILNAEQLQTVVEESQLGQMLELKVQRGERTQVISVRTSELHKVS
jgi:Do/DeqQ family serine protease